MHRASVLAATLLVGLAGCADTGVLTPANPQAQAIGSPQLHYLRGLPGGVMHITMPDGENLPGKFGIDENAAASPVSAEGGPAGDFGLTGGNFRAAGQGTKTILVCRATMIAGQGHGLCRDQNGALYRIDL